MRIHSSRVGTCESQHLKSWIMRNDNFRRIVVWLIVIAMVLTLVISFGALLFS